MTSSGRSSRAVGTGRPERPRSTPDPLAAAVEVWSSVVSGLESARYAEVGNEYAKLSALLVQQRTAQILAGAPLGQEWSELTRTAQRALDLLEPLLGAARILATMPSVPAPSPARPARRSRAAAPADKPARKSTAGRSTRTSPAPRAAPEKS